MSHPSYWGRAVNYFANSRWSSSALETTRLHLALTFHSRKGLPIISRVALMDTRFQTISKLVLLQFRPLSTLAPYDFLSKFQHAISRSTPYFSAQGWSSNLWNPRDIHYLCSYSSLPNGLQCLGGMSESKLCHMAWQDKSTPTVNEPYQRMRLTPNINIPYQQRSLWLIRIEVR